MCKPYTQRQRHAVGKIRIIREDHRHTGERPLYFVARMAGDDNGLERVWTERRLHRAAH